MPTALSLAPLTLAAVLILSGLAKLRDPGATASMIRALRLPMVLRRPLVAPALPWVELAVAALLLLPGRWTYALGALLASALFVAFLLVIARAMTFSPRPRCGCFGRVGDHRVSGRTVLRNALLVALAGICAALALAGESTASLIARYTATDWVWCALAIALALTAVLVLGPPAGGADEDDLWPATGEPAGSRAAQGSGRASVPAGVVVDSELRPSSLAALTRARPQLLILVNCWCGSTFTTIERLPRWRERLPHLGVPLVHTRAPWGEPRLAALPDVLWDPGSQLHTALAAGASPSAVLLGAGGKVLRGPVSGLEAIEALVDEHPSGET